MRTRRGVNAIEFALTFPLFVFVLAGMIDGGWLYVQRSAYDSAAHLGCRDGATRDPGTNNVNMASVRAHAVTRALHHLGSYGGDCNACSVNTEILYANPTRSLRCTVTGEFQPLFGVIDPQTLRGQAVVRLEFQR